MAGFTAGGGVWLADVCPRGRIGGVGLSLGPYRWTVQVDEVMFPCVAKLQYAYNRDPMVNTEYM